MIRGVGPIVAIAALLGAAACESATQSVVAPLADGSEQVVAQAIEAVTTFPAELDPRIWDGTHMKPEVRDASLRVVERIIADAGIEGLTVAGVDLFGSNASYEYDDASDFGMHAFVTTESMTSAKLSPILNLLNDDVERRQEGRIRFYGVPVEVSFHADRGETYQPQPGVGQYSITEGRWVVMPAKQPDNFDRAQMAADIEGFIAKYNDVVLAYQEDSTAFDCTRFSALDDEMTVYRNESFDAGLGSRSTHNLAYRALRRLNVSIPDMVDTLEDECTFVNESLR